MMKTIAASVADHIDRTLFVKNNKPGFERKQVFPGNALSVMLQLGEPIFELKGGENVSLPKVFVCGQMTRTRDFVCSPGSEVFMVKFKPWTARFFFDIDLRQITDRIVPLIDLTPVSGHLFDEIAATTAQQAMMSVLKRQYKFKSPEPAVIQAIDIVQKAGGALRVDDLARAVFHSTRNLERKFITATGLTPKQFINNTRLQCGLQVLYQYKNYGRAAYESGFYDQAHFANVIKKASGHTTGQLLNQLCRIFPIGSVVLNTSLQYRLIDA